MERSRYSKKLAYLIASLLVCTVPAHAASDDARTVVKLSPVHRAMVLAEMRMFISGIQQITNALAREDMQAVARVARSLGTAMSAHMPVELRKDLPQDFRKLGHSVHSQFDQIALDAESLEDSSHTLSQLSQTLADCVSCHSKYQIP